MNDGPIFTTEMEAVADAVWQLIVESVIPRDPKWVRKACVVTGIPTSALQQAKVRFEAGQYRPPQTEDLASALARRAGFDPSPTPAPPAPAPSGTRARLAPAPPPPPAPAPRKKPPPRTIAAAAVNSKQPTPDESTINCGRCGQDKPLEEFPFRQDRPHTRWTVCTDCRRARQKERYLSAAKEKALDEARIIFVVNDTDELTGLACKDCGGKFQVGDHVTGTTKLRHETCPTT